MSGLRRRPDAVLAAHQLDPARKELYVEGPSDRVFLNWLTEGSRDPNARVLEIGTVDIDVPSGGERGRLLAFGQIISDSPARILLLADADEDRLLGRAGLAKVLLTDGRDMESYVLNRESCEKCLRLGLRDEASSPEELLREVLEIATTAGRVRLLATREGLSLPFQKTSIERYVRQESGGPTLNLRRYIRALVQNAGISLGQVPLIEDKVRGLQVETAKSDLVHGKDAMRVLEVLLKRAKVRRDEGQRLLWTSFERSWVPRYPALSAAVTFLQG